MVLAEVPITTSVLLIDDKEADLHYWSDTVKNLSSNYTVLNANNCKSGLDICRTRAVDCVLLDLDMPESGFHALLELIPDRKLPQIAVVILTHLVHPVLCEMAKHNGAQGWLIKQYTSAEELDIAIRDAVTSVKSKREH